jgi:Xaa-Pro dipeptidase
MDFKEVIDAMHSQEIDSLIIFKPENIAYLSGFKPSSSSILILKDDAVLFTSKMEIDNALNQSKVQVAELKSLNEVKKTLQGTVGIENSLSVFTYKKICNDFKTKLTDVVESSRIIKADYEVKCIENAIKIAENSLMNTEIFETENKIAAELEFNMKMEGSIKPAFDTIVASGVRSSLPHATVTLNKLEFPVVIDWGAVYNNYCSDTTRTIIKNEKQAELFEIVLEAQKKAIKVIKPGIKASYVDKVARKVIEDYGYGSNFIHSTGHGLGLEVHEKPLLSQSDKSKLQEGMVITVEPGIYIKDEFGVRIEDVVLIKKNTVRLNKIKTEITL